MRYVEVFRHTDNDDDTLSAEGIEAEMLHDGERALVVGHSPTNEAAVLGLAAAVVAPMGKGEAVLVTEQDRKFSVRALY